ncbi:Wnt-activated receptor, variant 2 [Balamuthia mandrillaris]
MCKYNISQRHRSALSCTTLPKHLPRLLFVSPQLFVVLCFACRAADFNLLIFLAKYSTTVDQCTDFVNSLGHPIGSALYFPPTFSFPLTCMELEADGTPLYQQENYTIQNGDMQNVTMHCNPFTASSLGIICDPPIENECSFTCPLPAYSEEQYDDLKVLQLVFGWLSLAGSLVVILSYALHPKLRKFPSNLIIMTAVAAHLASVAIILPTFSGYTYLWCGSDEELISPSTQLTWEQVDIKFSFEELSVKSELCTFQGWLLQFGFVSSIMWWGIISFNMFLSVFFLSKLPTGKWWTVGLQVFYHVCGWVVPAILTLIPAAAGKMVFTPASSVCEVSTEDNYAYFLTFWTLPVGIVLLIGLVLFVCSLVKLVHISHKLKDLKKACSTYFRVLLFIVIFLIMFCFIFAYSLQVAANLSAVEEGYSEYYTCLLQRKPDCELSEDVHNYPLAVLRGLGFSCLGFLLFLNFCSSFAIGKFWWNASRHLIRGDFSSAFSVETSVQSASKSKPRKRKTDEKLTVSMAEMD